MTQAVPASLGHQPVFVFKFYLLYFWFIFYFTIQHLVKGSLTSESEAGIGVSHWWRVGFCLCSCVLCLPWRINLSPLLFWVSYLEQWERESVKQEGQISEITPKPIFTTLLSHQKGNFKPLSSFYKPLNFQLLPVFSQGLCKTVSVTLRRKFTWLSIYFRGRNF